VKAVTAKAEHNAKAEAGQQAVLSSDRSCVVHCAGCARSRAAGKNGLHGNSTARTLAPAARAWR